MTTIRKEMTKDIAAREALLDRAFGEARSARIANGAASGVRATAVLRKAVMARQSPLPGDSKPRGSVVGKFTW